MKEPEDVDVDFNDAKDVNSIGVRLHPIDVGFDLRKSNVTVQLPDESEIRVSYPDKHGERRVMHGSRQFVKGRLEELGFTFQ